MKRMITDPGMLIECNHENIGRETVIYIPIKDRSELPVAFDLMIPNRAIIISIIAYYSYNNDEIYGGGVGLDPIGNAIKLNCEVDSLAPNKPFLTIRMDYVRGDLSMNVLDNDEKLFVSNIVHLSKIPLEYII